MKKLFFLLCLFLALISLPAFAGPVPDTGQTKCYDNNAEIPCPLPGEPFYGQDAQYTCNPHSYTDLGNGIVQDNVTGLMWQMYMAPGTYTWQQAITYCDNLVLPAWGYSDWRLPTIKELSTLVDSGIPYPGPTINTTYFPDAVASYYWSSTTNDYYTGYVWSVFFYYGLMSYLNNTNYLNVLAVRGGPLPNNNFIDNGDGTVRDTTTGLMWKQATAPGTYTWEQALTYCENLTLPADGYNDWRLPNRNELQSIVDYTRYNPSIDTTAFFGMVASFYWSSTPDAYNTNFAWGVFFNGGYVGYSGKTDGHHVLAVRAGHCDSDEDGILNDGDNSTVDGDNPCTGGEMVNCDDNCVDTPNPGQEDLDGDGVGDACDNCPSTPNGPNNGTCIMTSGNIVYSSNSALLEPCSDNSTCEPEETCQMEQGDINANGIGDVCECYADCDNSSQVNVFDLIILKNEYNRNDCSVNPCNADCNDDGNVNVFDLIVMKNQYNRNGCPVIP